MNPRLNWHQQADLLGVRVRVYFFDPEVVGAHPDFVGRNLPILQDSGVQLMTPDDPQTVPESQRNSYAVPGLVAQPDAVLAHGNGLICLTYRSQQGRNDRLATPDTWRQHCRADLMLQCVATTMAVAGQCQLPTAALWRGANMLCQFDPGPLVLDCLASHIGAARQYWNESGPISPAQLAGFCETRLRAMPGLVTADLTTA